MDLRYGRALLLRALILCLLAGPRLMAADGTVYDLKTDWSTNSNPNGVWSYRAGTKVLPAYIWYAGLQESQPSWGDVFPLSSPSRLPAWFKSRLDPVGGLDWKAGDVVVHTQDDLNGSGNGQANILWTSPFTGWVKVTGNAWMARDSGRANIWSITRNGTQLSSGSLYSGDPFSRDLPFDFLSGSGGSNALQNIPVSQGDQIVLQISRNSTYGDFVGANFTVTQQFPNPTLTIRVSQVELCFDTVTNAWYQLLYSTSVNTNWQPFGTNYIFGTGVTYCTNDTIVAGMPDRFYRVQVTNGIPVN